MIIYFEHISEPPSEYAVRLICAQCGRALDIVSVDTLHALACRREPVLCFCCDRVRADLPPEALQAPGKLLSVETRPTAQTIASNGLDAKSGYEKTLPGQAIYLTFACGEEIGIRPQGQPRNAREQLGGKLV